MDRFNLGAHTRKVRTSSAEAQRWFDLGLNWCFGFNQEEGVKCFRRALEFDPDCVMAHWGIAYGSGPFYNLVWRDFGKAEADRFAKVAFDHLQIALALSAGTEDAERHLVEALARRFQEPNGVAPSSSTDGTTIMPLRCAASITPFPTITTSWRCWSRP
jgi:hypothetical protein